MIEGFEVGEEGALLEFLEISNSVAARKVELELWNDAMEKEYPRRNYLLDKTGKGRLISAPYP